MGYKKRWVWEIGRAGYSGQGVSWVQSCKQCWAVMKEFWADSYRFVGLKHSCRLEHPHGCCDVVPHTADKAANKICFRKQGIQLLHLVLHLFEFAVVFDHSTQLLELLKGDYYIFYHRFSELGCYGNEEFFPCPCFVSYLPTRESILGSFNQILARQVHPPVDWLFINFKILTAFIEPSLCILSSKHRQFQLG